jgi:Domain of unknown function (DUF4126)
MFLAYSPPREPHLVGRPTVGGRCVVYRPQPRPEQGSAPRSAQRMKGTLFDIGLGLGLATACGLRPYLPALLAGALGSAGALDVGFGSGRFHFLQAGWWLLAVAVVLALTYLLQLRVSVERFGPSSAMVAAHAIGVGALLFAGILSQHRDVWWPGLVAGAAAATLAHASVTPLLQGARARLPDRSAREALTVYVDGGSLALAALVALLHVLGLIAPLLAAWLLLRIRARAGAKYAGLRIMRR